MSEYNMNKNTINNFLLGMAMMSAVLGLLLMGYAFGDSVRNETNLASHALVSPSLILLISSSLLLLLPQIAKQQ